MGIANTTAPKSNQQNYDDYTAGPKTVTIQSWRELPGAAQPYELHLVEFPGKPYKPSKGMRRVLIRAWGENDDDYIGRRMTLYGNPDVLYAGEKVGGIQISHLSHIKERLLFSLTISKGKRGEYIVQPLPDAPAPIDNVAEWITALNTAQSIGDLQGAWEKAAAAGVTNRPDVIAAKDARKKELA